MGCKGFSVLALKVTILFFSLVPKVLAGLALIRALIGRIIVRGKVPDAVD